MSAASAWAGGFYVPEIGSRATSMGAAVTACADDATGVLHNPATMTGEGGTRVLASGTVFFPSVTFFRRPLRDPSTGETVRFDGTSNTNAVGAAPFLGAVADLLDQDLTIGLAAHVPFGAVLRFPSDGSQRHIVTQIDLKAIHVSPAAAYRLSDRVTVGASLNYVFGELALEQRNAVQYLTGRGG